MTITRVPSFLSSRPGFPAGLRVLLLDAPATAREACAQLRQCAYAVTAVSTSGEALEAIAAAAEPFDVLLADAALLSSKCSKQLKDALKELPTLVMSENPKPQEVLASISMGVAEVVEKPLCPLKLKNIWQHTVRRVMGPRLQRCCSKQGLVHGADRKGSVSRLGSLEHSSQSGTPLHLELSPQLSRDLNNTATSCDVLPSSPAASGGCPRGTDGCKDVQADSRRGQKRKLEEAACSPATAPCTAQHQQHQQLGAATDVASCPEAAVPPAACSAGLPAASVGLPQPTAAACAPMPVLPHTVAPLPTWPCACPSPPALGPCNLPPGMVWGAPMNPAHVAPGITPPIFPPPVAPPALGPMPGQAWPPCVPPALPPPFPLAGAGIMPGMPTMMMLPGMMPPPACPFMPPSMAAPLPGQLAPLPLPMLMTACAPCPVLPSPGTPPVTAPGLVLPSCSPCSPGSTQPPATSSLSERSSQDGLFSAGSHRGPALKAKMPRCESSPLLPSLEDLMAPASTSAEECADMDLDLDTLSLAFRRNNSLEDLMAPPVVAF